MYIHTHTQKNHATKYLSMYVLHVCMHECTMYVCKYVCTYVRVYTYIHIYKLLQAEDSSVYAFKSDKVAFLRP